MRKHFILSLVALSVTFTSCNKTDASGVKIDFTQSYEDAASALATAQKNYDEALLSKDTAKIEAAKTALESAQQKYTSSKEVLINKGGQVKEDYEKVFEKTKQTIVESTSPAPIVEGVKSTVENTTKDVVDGVKSDVKTEVKTQVDTKVKAVHSDLKASTEKAKVDVQNKIDQSKTEIKASTDKVKADINAKNEEVKKAVDGEVSKAKDKLNNLFK
jgi:sugar-specific transcriptional regulator TrmB